MKKLLSLMLSLAMVLSLTATVAGAAESPEPVEIRVAWWGDTNRHELYNSILAAFMEKYPYITCVPEPVSWTDYWDKMQVQSAGGNAPDFMGMHAQYASDYINRGVCEPLDGYIADGTISLEGWTEGTIATGVVNGVTYMIPMGITFSSSLVNVGKLREMGLESPSFDWTWEEMKTWGLAVRAALDAQGLSEAWAVNDISTSLNSWRYYVRQQGHELYNEDGGIGFTAEDAQTFWEMYNEFRELGIVPDAATSTEYTNATLEDSLFSRDKVMVTMVPVNQYKLYRTTFPDKEIGIIRNQSGGESKAVGEFPEGAHFAVSANTTQEKKDAAALLLNFWVNSPEGLAIFGLDQGVPGNLSMADSYAARLDAYQVEIQKFVATMMDIGTATTFAPSGASEVDSTFKLYAEEVMYGVKTPEQAAREFYDAATEIIAKANTK